MVNLGVGIGIGIRERSGVPKVNQSASTAFIGRGILNRVGRPPRGEKIMRITEMEMEISGN